MANVIDLRPPGSYSPLTQGKMLSEDFLVANLASGNIQLSDFSWVGVASGTMSPFLYSNTVATSGTFTIDTSKFYRLEITTTWKQGSNNNYYATFKVFDGGSVVFNETISLNYYIASYGIQYAAAAVIILNSGTTATTMLYIDYLEYGTTRRLRR